MPALLLAMSPGPEECLSPGRCFGSIGLMKKGIDMIHCNPTIVVIGERDLGSSKLGPVESQHWVEDQLDRSLPRWHWHWAVSLSG